MLDENYKEIAANLNFGKSLYFNAGAEHFRLTGLSHYEHAITGRVLHHPASNNSISAAALSFFRPFARVDGFYNILITFRSFT